MAMMKGIFQFRLLSSLRGVTIARNQELIAYQTELRRLRQKYRSELSNQPTKAEQAATQRAAKSTIRTKKWSTLLKSIKDGLMDPKSDVSRDRPPCRPIVMNRKGEIAQARGRDNLSSALAYHQIARRRVITLLGRQLLQLPEINYENLEARIQLAINSPTNFNIRPEMLIEQEGDLKKQLGSIRVPKDLRIFAVGRDKPTKIK
jgi:hypothetical protein